MVEKKTTILGQAQSKVGFHRMTLLHDRITLGWICRSCGTINETALHYTDGELAKKVQLMWCVLCPKCGVLYDITLKKTPDSMQITLQEPKTED